MITPRLKIGFLCFGLLAGGRIMAGDPVPQDSTHHIKAVSITRQRPLVDYGVQKTEPDSLILEESLLCSLSELLARHSTVFIKSYGSGSLATSSFRGTSASHTRVEWNGIPLNDPMLGQADFSLIPVYFLDRVSLYYGSGSMLHASGGLGGSIHLSSVPQWHESFYGEIIQGAGSFDTYRTMTAFGGGSPHLQFRIRAIHDQSENDFRFLNTANGTWEREQQHSARYRLDGILGEAHFRQGNHKVAASLWMQDATRNLPPIMSYEGKGRKEFRADRQMMANIRWNYYGRVILSRFTSGYTQTGLRYFLGEETDEGFHVTSDSESNTRTLHNQYTLEAGIGESTLLRGTLRNSLQRAETADEQTLAGYSAIRSETEAGISIHHRFNEMLTSYLLLKESLAGREFSPFMPSAGVEFLPLGKESLALKLNVGKNTHYPTLNDLHWIPGGNPDLRPEKGLAMDLTAAFSQRLDSSVTIHSAITGFMTRVNDWIIWQPGEFGYWQAGNIREVLSRGFEYNLITRMIFHPLKMDLYGNYSFTWTTDETTETVGEPERGNQLIYIPVHKGSLTVFLSWSRYRFSYGPDFVGERFTTSAGNPTLHSLPGYLLHNVSGALTFRVWKTDGELRLRADNLLNADYQSVLWRPMPGRSFTVLLKLSF
ncbi:MAG: TonB-dependent receptor plug domain-containing protein [Bacteroidales bacterium]|nr:TonB-dependent receptor plug domain-containing protein [Bacteroidales bacterium]